MSDDLEAARQNSQSWYWWGIPTFFRCPWNEDPKQADIGLVGVPHSSGIWGLVPCAMCPASTGARISFMASRPGT